MSRKVSRQRKFEFRHEGKTNYFYVAEATLEQRSALARKGIKPGFTVALRHFWIDPAQRGTGLGSKLLDFIMGAIDALHLPVCLYVKAYDNGRLNDAGLASFYQSRGFRLVNISRHPEWKGCAFMFREAR